MLKSVWKNVIGIVALFSVIFCIFYFNIKVGFSAFDYSKTTLNNVMSLTVFIAFLSVFLAILSVILVIVILIYIKRKKVRNNER